ncbi:hypothetical protein MLD38_030528 [Melastoma candidum]|uniref:Uncharacterized protein n=1 Tax=Melastoma candidum TaxID=119954 RepID=A0ACB9MP05_9MYRT|nr:hypothetical protein MLD38_030528 [Melastoma candidum]
MPSSLLVHTRRRGPQADNGSGGSDPRRGSRGEHAPLVLRALLLYADNQEHKVFFTESSSSQSSRTRSSTSVSTVAYKNQTAVSENSAPSRG